MFGTLTFNKEKINRLDDEQVVKKSRVWLQNQKRLNQNFEYLIIPERHKQTRGLHLHFLFMGYPDKKLVRAHSARSGRPLFDSNHRPIYNLTSWKLGYTQVTFIENKEATSYYVRKYISKDVDMTDRLKEKDHRFWASHGLEKPLKLENVALELYLPENEPANRSHPAFDMWYRPNVSIPPNLTIKQ